MTINLTDCNYYDYKFNFKKSDKFLKHMCLKKAEDEMLSVECKKNIKIKLQTNKNTF